MSTSVYEQAITLADTLNTQGGRYQGTLSETNKVDQAMTLVEHELGTVARAASAISPNLQEAARLSTVTDYDAQTQVSEQLEQAIRTLYDAKEALLRVTAHHKTAQQSMAQLMEVLGNESARSCVKAIAKAYKACEAMAKQCQQGKEELEKLFCPHDDAIKLAQELKEKADEAQKATSIANGQASEVGASAEKLRSAIDTLELPGRELIEALLGQLEQASDDLTYLPGPDVAETLAAAARGAMEAAQKVTSAELNGHIAKAGQAVQDAVNALKSL